MAEVVDWQGAEPGEMVKRATEFLCSGRLVVFPTDTYYEMAALAADTEAVVRLQGAEHRPLTVALRSPTDVVDWIPDLGILGRRLARRCWPGPMTLVARVAPAGGMAGNLPEGLRRRLCASDRVSFRVPAHAAIHRVLRLVPGSVVLADAGDQASTAEQALALVGERAALIINDGPSHFGQNTTVVQVDGEDWNIVRPGVISAAELEVLAACRILFVCTGNTCRSPLAQALCSKLLAERLGCTPEELPQRGFVVQSAGLAAMIGGEAAAEAVTVARELGADLSSHRSQPLSRELLEQADFLFAMTRSHLQMLLDIDLPGTAVPRLLSAAGDDIPDPIGSPAEVYRDCARQMLRHLEEVLPELR